MSTIFERLLLREKKSATTAKERLKLVLVHDRMDLTSSALDSLKDELIAVISKYVSIDTDAVEININQEGREQTLIAIIPLRAPRKRGVR